MSERNRLLEKYAGVNLKFTKTQCKDIVKAQISQLKIDGESDEDIREFFDRLMSRQYNPVRVRSGVSPEVIAKIDECLKKEPKNAIDDVVVELSD